jgi:hypothetical protein
MMLHDPNGWIAPSPLASGFVTTFSLAAVYGALVEISENEANH